MYFTSNNEVLFGTSKFQVQLVVNCQNRSAIPTLFALITEYTHPV